MASFYVWETVDFKLVLEKDGGGVFDGIKDVIVSFRQPTGGRKAMVEKDLKSGSLIVDGAENSIIVHLGQEDTAVFKAAKDVLVQVNLLYENGERDTSVQESIEALSNLHEEVMS